LNCLRPAFTHLRGASAAGMGKPVWLLSLSNGCWRWLTEDMDSPPARLPAKLSQAIAQGSLTRLSRISLTRFAVGNPLTKPTEETKPPEKPVHLAQSARKKNGVVQCRTAANHPRFFGTCIYLFRERD
jgi:hypothetical protein